MDRKFFEAAIPEPWTILGRRLRPFSIGHIFILHRFGSDFTGNGSGLIPLEVIQAVYFCSKTYEEGLEAIDSPNLMKDIAAWSKAVTGQGTLLNRLGLKKERQIDWGEKSKMMVDYMNQALDIPTYSETGEGANTHVDLPTAQIVKVTLMRYMGLSESEALNRPWALSVWDFVTIKAMEGQVNVYDSTALDAAQEQANELAKKMKARKEEQQDGTG